MNDAPPTSTFGRFSRALGPALIVASVVLGPGSILSSSKVGAAYGFRMAWVVLLAGVLMMGMVAMGARLGVVLKGTMCDELAARIGRPLAAIVGLTIFLVCAAFQFGNNLGVLAALQPFPNVSPTIVLVVLNLAVIVFLYGFRQLYKPVETMMKVLVGLMIFAFAGNFVYMLVVGDQSASTETTTATSVIASPNSDLFAVIGIMGTTFSVAGAFYQAYLVREKQWGMAELKQGLVDSVVGIGVLAAITLVIMSTAAMSFAGKGVELKNAADVARQLQPLFGPAAVILFSCGIFAASFSSFLVNAMIGGAMLSDGLGLGGSMDGAWTKRFTVIALLSGMLVAILIPSHQDRVGLVVFAQAMVVLGFPLLAISMVYLATRSDLTDARRIPAWMKGVGLFGIVVVCVSAGLLAIKLIPWSWWI